MPMELRLELMTIIGSDLPDTEGELFDDVIGEVYCVCLRMFS